MPRVSHSVKSLCLNSLVSVGLNLSSDDHLPQSLCLGALEGPGQHRAQHPLYCLLYVGTERGAPLVCCQLEVLLGGHTAQDESVAIEEGLSGLGLDDVVQ